MTLRIATLCIGLFIIACGKSPRQSSSNGSKAMPEQSIPDDLTESEREFLEMMEQAFRTNDPAPLVARICWDGVDNMLHEQLDDYIVEGVKRGLKSFDFQRVDSETHTKRTEDGTTVIENLPVMWKLIVYHTSNSEMTVSTEYLLGEKGGKVQFTNAIVQ